MMLHAKKMSGYMMLQALELLCYMLLACTRDVALHAICRRDVMLHGSYMHNRMPVKGAAVHEAPNLRGEKDRCTVPSDALRFFPSILITQKILFQGQESCKCGTSNRQPKIT